VACQQLDLPALLRPTSRIDEVSNYASVFDDPCRAGTSVKNDRDVVVLTGRVLLGILSVGH